MSLSFQQKTKQRIALGGKSKQTETRQELLKRAHADRERRAKERAELKAALYIQGCWKSYITVTQAQNAERAYFNHHFGSNADSWRSWNETDLGRALRSLAYFYSSKNSVDTHWLVLIVQSKLDAHSGLATYISATVKNEPQTALIQIVRLARIFTAVASCLEVQLSGNHAGTQLLKPPILHSLLMFLQSSAGNHEWNKAGSAANERHRQFFLLCHKYGAPQKLVDAILSRLKERCVDQKDAETFQMACQALVELLDIPGRPRDKRVRGAVYATQLLKRPLLWARCPSLKSRAANLLRQFSHEVSFRTLPIERLAGEDPQSLMALLGNLAEGLAELRHVKSALPAADLLTVLSVVTKLLRHDTAKQLLGDVYAIDSDSNGMDWTSVSLPRDEVKGQVYKVVTGSALCRLAQIFLEGHQKPSMETIQTEIGPRLWTWCSFVLTLDQIEPDEICPQVEIALATSHSLVPLLWNTYFKPCLSAGKWYVPETNETSDPGWLAPLNILSQAFSGYLSTRSPEEFYKQQEPLPFLELYQGNSRGLIDLLRTSLFQALWSDSKTINQVAKAARAACAAASGRLMGQLYDRNCRREFVPAHAFVTEQLNGRLFLQEVHSLLQQEEFMEAAEARPWKILQYAPFLVPFEIRAQTLQAVIEVDKFQHYHPTDARIRRGNIFWDGYEALHKAKAQDLKGRLRIVFEDEYGMQEAGIDGGGLFKDFMENLVKQAFDPAFGLFLATSDNRLYPNPNARLATAKATSAFEYIGKMVGKALYEGIIVELPLAVFFLKQLLNRGAEVNDLMTLDAELYKNLMFLNSYEGDVEDLALTFTISAKTANGSQEEVELVPNGRERVVTNNNKEEYILRMANYRLNIETRRFTDAFRRGMELLIQPEWLCMFNEEELQMLIAGIVSSGLDIEDLRKHVEYGNGYTPDHPTIQLLWQVLSEFSPQQQNAWLRFVTSCSRPPLLGFKHLQPPLIIAKALSNSEESSQQRLPTSSTCSNLLKLPPIETKQALASKLLFAIENVAGFDLS